MKPIETEVKLDYVKRQLGGKWKDYEASITALDEIETKRTGDRITHAARGMLCFTFELVFSSRCRLS